MDGWFEALLPLLIMAVVISIVVLYFGWMPVIGIGVLLLLLGKS